MFLTRSLPFRSRVSSWHSQKKVGRKNMVHTLEISGAPTLFPRRPAVVNVRVRVRDRRLRLTVLFALFVLLIEFERVANGL